MTSHGQQFDESFDLVIVGSGGGSVPAALVARDADKSALIVEKQARIGGSTGYSGGTLWIANNPLMAREGVADSYERARRHFDAAVWYMGPGSSPQRREAYLRSGPEMVAYLERKGMAWRRPEGYSDYYDGCPGASRGAGCSNPSCSTSTSSASGSSASRSTPGGRSGSIRRSSRRCCSRSAPGPAGAPSRGSWRAP